MEPATEPPASNPPRPPRPPRPRPQNLTPHELGFERQDPVHWLAPRLLAATAIRVLGFQFFGAYLDKRELQGALPSHTYDHSLEAAPDDGEFWFDFVADLGDGFDATYSVAWLLAQPELTIGDETLERGRVLVLGGDEVYPTPDRWSYDNRFRGPYRAAFPVPPNDEQGPPTLYALPGNHDWYDGLTAFLRVFAKDAQIGGWHTRQTRSYFALHLPHRWWLFAVDTQLSSYIDKPQLDYFIEAASRLAPGDRVILCVPEPAWVATPDAADAYDPIDFFLRKVITQSEATCEVVLTGDMHHYARYQRVQETAEAEKAPQEFITCGGGGAFTSDTYHLPERLELPSRHTMARDASPSKDYTLEKRFPSAGRSRRYAWGIFGRLLQHNQGFSTMIGVIHVLLLMAFLTSQRHLVTLPSVTMCALVIAGAVALSGSGNVHKRKFKNRVAGAVHGIAHIGLGVVGTAIWLQLPFEDLPSLWPVATAFLVYGPIAGVVGTELIALYLLAASRFGINLNELHAGQSIEDSKSFLRMRIDANGSLTIFPVGLDRACHSWEAAPDDPPEASWVKPRRTIEPHLIEDPIHVE